MKRSQRVQKQITEALQQYPDRELLFLYPNEADNIALEYFTMKDFSLSDEQVKWVVDKAKDYIECLEWKKP